MWHLANLLTHTYSYYQQPKAATKSKAATSTKQPAKTKATASKPATKAKGASKKKVLADHKNNAEESAMEVDDNESENEGGSSSKKSEPGARGKKKTVSETYTKVRHAPFRPNCDLHTVLFRVFVALATGTHSQAPRCLYR